MVADEKDIKILREHAGLLSGRLLTPDLSSIKNLNAKDIPRKFMILPEAGSPTCVEFVFWHEFAHDVIDLAGLQKEFLRHESQNYHPDEWPYEWLCDKFAYLMVMYRSGIELLTALTAEYGSFFAPDPAMIKEMQTKDSRQPLCLLISKDIEKQLELHTVDHRAHVRLSVLAGLILEHTD